MQTSLIEPIREPIIIPPTIIVPKFVPPGRRRCPRAVGDLAGNVKLKNINDAVASTISPSTSSSTYVVISEMTLTFTTKGNKVILLFESAITMTTTGTQLSGNIALFKDGSQLSPDYLVTITQTGSENLVFTISVGFIDNPTAASHTYDDGFESGVGAPTVVAFGTARRFQAVELG